MKTAECHPDQKYFALGKCKECYYRDYNAKKNNSPDGRTYWRMHNLKRDFGITIEEYDAMLTKQGGVCAICKRPPNKNRLAVDHDHTTGEVRGLLCPSCNRAVGYFENGTWRQAAENYLNIAS